MVSVFDSSCRTSGDSPEREPPWDRLRELPLPTRTQLKRFAPRLAYGRHWGPIRPGTRAAAVAVLVYPGPSGWSTLLIRRPLHAPRHAGQVCFPGGVVERGESSCDAMRRELQEEVGVAPASVEVLRQLRPVYVYASGFLMYPWLCRSVSPVEFVPDDREVHELLELPLMEIPNPQAWGQHWITRGALSFSAPALIWQGHAVWGATALVLGQLRRLLEQPMSQETGYQETENSNRSGRDDHEQ